MKKWTEKEIVYLKRWYPNNIKNGTLCSNLGRSWSSITSKAHELGLIRCSKCRHTYTIRDNYFRCIDSNEKSYLLGLLFADGYNNTNVYSVRLSVAEKDKELVTYLRDKVYIGNRPFLFTKGQGNCSDQVGIQIWNKKLSLDLERHGMVQCKTHVLVFPDINKEYYSSFIRGYFDGDGCVYNDKKNTRHITLVGTNSLCSTIKNILTENDISCNVYSYKHTSQKVLRFGGNCNAKKFATYIYQNANGLYLTRKYKKFKELL